MMRWFGLLLCLPMICYGEYWDFGEPVPVSDPTLAPHYHHLDGAGRRHLTVSGDHVALVWEDDRTGSPQVYVAWKKLTDSGFSRSVLLSTGAEAYEPSIASVGPGWVVVWEQDGQIWGTLVTPEKSAPPARLSSGPARQVTLAADGIGRIAAVWGDRTGSIQRLVITDLRVDSDNLRADSEVRKVTEDPTHDQNFPAAAFNGRGELFVVWEDRRAGHTRIFGRLRGQDGSFGPEIELNEYRNPEITESYLANKGTGAMRVSVAGGVDGRMKTVWLDKRNPGSGYAVWGAASEDGGLHFGINARVQDTMGDAVAQWHASVVSAKGGFIAVWDDARENWSDEEETGDVILSVWQDGNWEDDWIVPGASGSGYQGSPVVAQDGNGDLHLAWIEKETLTAPSRLRYMHGVRRD